MNAQQGNKKFILTKEGLSDLKSEYEKLVKIQRPAITARIKNAREFGDLAENSEYDAAKEEQSLLETRITDLEDILNRVEIVSQQKQGEFVVIGSTIKVQVDGQTDEFTIVGTIEANPAQKKISNESLVGASLIGAKVGEVVEVVTPIFRTKYKILEIK